MSQIRSSPARSLLRRHWPKLSFLLSLCVLLALWYLVDRFTDVPEYILPPIATFFDVLRQGLFSDPTSPVSYWYHAANTVGSALVGFVIGGALGIVLAIGISQSAGLRAIIWPYVTGFQSVPKVAIAPLILLWFGFGVQSQILIVVLTTFFPVFINALSGFRSPDPEMMEMMDSLEASRAQKFRIIQFPSALPFIFAGFEVAVVFSLIGSIVAEFIGGSRGIGVLILRAQFATDTASTIALLLVLAVIGVVLSKLLALTRRRVLFWSPDLHKEEMVTA